MLDGLRVRPGGRYIDATVGAGGHAAGMLEAAAPDGRLLALDRDRGALEVARARLAPFGARVTLVHRSFAQLAEVAREHGFVPADGVLADLGLSSLQLEAAGRGFSFLADGPLDMRFDQEAEGPSAAELVNELPLAELARLLRLYGEEPQAQRIAEAIVRARPVRSTRHLAEVVADALGGRGSPGRPRGAGRGRIHPATRTFQALRIAVNDELGALEAFLPQAVRVLAPGGRLAVISFHSLEDRVVKRFLQREGRNCICPPELPVCRCDHRATLRILTRTPIRPGEEEVRANPRARSARLRVAERLATSDSDG